LFFAVPYAMFLTSPHSPFPLFFVPWWLSDKVILVVATQNYEFYTFFLLFNNQFI